MARIPMTSGFTVIPEGTYVFRIYDATYDESFGKVVVKMVNAKGQTHAERFSLLSQNGTWNEKALNAFSFFCKTAIGDDTIETCDPAELVGHYIKGVIVHTVQPNKNDPTQNVTFANMKDKWSADSFDTEPVPRALNLGTNLADAPTAPVVAPAEESEPETTTAPTGADLLALLGD